MGINGNKLQVSLLGNLNVAEKTGVNTFDLWYFSLMSKK